jgi:cellulose synthase/poly-beta-1,6-N-acetylglucosamine synthase-like glycosyltransferase
VLPSGSLSPRDALTIVFSIIIPTLNEEKFIGQCLAALAQQTLPLEQFEVIIVDNGSSDGTLDVVSDCMSMIATTVIRKTKCNISEARNSASALAKGSFLAFLDADCLPSANWLKRAIDLVRRGDGGVIGAFYTIPEPSTWVARAWYGDLARANNGAVRYVPSGTLFIDRSVFHKLGGFDAAIQTSEDFEFCQRVASAGYQVLSYPELSTLHLGTPQTVSAFFQKQRWHGSGIRTVFGRNMLERGFVATVVYTLLVSMSIVFTAAALPFAFLTEKPLVVLLPCGFLLLTSVAMAVKGAIRRRNLRLIFPLTILFTVYGVARSVALLGLGARRDRRMAVQASRAAAAD